MTVGTVQGGQAALIRRVGIDRQSRGYAWRLKKFRIGAPEKVVRQVRALEEKGGIGELAIVSNFGGLEHWKSIKIQHMFAKHVMPAFRRSRTEARAAD